MRSLTLLGPQRLTPTLPEAVAAVGVDLSPGQPPLATVTAGWQEREDEDADLVAALLGNTVNLRLYARVADIFERDPDLARAHRERGHRLRDIQTLYELRLGHAMDAVYELLRRTTEGWLIDDEVESALGAVRALDERVLALNAEVTGGVPGGVAAGGARCRRRPSGRRRPPVARRERAGDRRRTGADAAEPAQPARCRRPRARSSTSSPGPPAPWW